MFKRFEKASSWRNDFWKKEIKLKNNVVVSGFYGRFCLCTFLYTRVSKGCKISGGHKGWTPSTHTHTDTQTHTQSFSCLCVRSQILTAWSKDENQNMQGSERLPWWSDHSSVCYLWRFMVWRCHVLRLYFLHRCRHKCTRASLWHSQRFNIKFGVTWLPPSGRLSGTRTGAAWFNWWTRTLSCAGKRRVLIWGMHSALAIFRANVSPLSHRSIYTDDCLGPGNLKMVELARQVGGV